MSTDDRSPERMVAVVWPADRFLGRYVALELVRRGFDVALIGEAESVLREIALAVLHAGGRALALEASAQDSATVSAAVAQVRERLGAIDVWTILNAETAAPEADHSRASASLVSTSAGEVGWCLSDVADVMGERSCGTVVSVESILAFVPSATHPELSSAAFARRALLASLRRRALADDKHVKFCSVYTGIFADPEPVTDCIALDRQARLVARAASRSAVDGRRQRCVSMATWRAVVVARLLPGLVEQWSDLALSGTPLAFDPWDWQELRRATRGRRRNIVRGWRPTRQVTS